MKWYDKILLGFLSLAAILLSLLTLFFVAYPFYAARLAALWQRDATASIVACSLAVMMIAASVRLIAWLFTKKRVPSSVLVRQGDNGTSFMTVSALNGMVARFVEAGDSVRECKTTVVPVGDAVRILVRAGAKQDAVIPVLAEELQRGVKSYVETYGGVRVESVEVVIETTEPSAVPTRVS